MRHITLLAAGVLLVTASGNAGAGPILPAGLSHRGDLSSIELIQDKRVQEKRKSDTVTQRVKRAWKNLVGYKFNVACPVLIPLSHTTCTETGKDRGDARAKCASRNPFCYITEASR
ncbi:MAG: hypothetical protein HY244_08865 [Rhizobiales bacterium]|nr:hypothetical protein [Hyphomicrobiales bacterium]